MRLLLLFLFFYPSLIFSQNSSDVNRGFILKADAELSIQNSKKYALIVGSNHYNASNWEALNNAEYDAKTIKKVLTEKYNFECELLLSPNRTEFQEKIAYFHKTLKKQDRFLLYIAGHGDFEAQYNRDGFIVFNDSKPTKSDLFRNSYLSYSNFNNILNALPSKHVGVILDVCFGGAFNQQLKKSRSNLIASSYPKKKVEEFVNEKLQKTTRVYLTSGSLETVSDGIPGEHSPFCHYLLTALERQDFDGFPITLSSIFQYLKRNTSEALYGGFGENSPASDFIIGNEHSERALLFKKAETAYELGKHKEAFKVYLELAENENLEAQCKVASFYDEGIGVYRNTTKALEWYIKAADHGSEQAQIELGKRYNKGSGVTRDYLKALKWYTKASEKGNIIAMKSIGTLYYYGHGMSKNYAKALEYYKKPAENGDPYAQTNIGHIYFYGSNGVKKDVLEAQKWYEKACKNGSANACRKLNTMK